MKAFDRTSAKVKKKKQFKIKITEREFFQDNNSVKTKILHTGSLN